MGRDAIGYSFWSGLDRSGLVLMVRAYVDERDITNGLVRQHAPPELIAQILQRHSVDTAMDQFTTAFD